MAISNKSRDEKGSKIKTPPALKDDPTDKHPPKFSFRYLSKKYCFSKCQNHEKLAFAEQVFKISQLPWAELRQQHRHGLGYEKISRDSIKPDIPSHITADVNIIAFRFYKLAPMVGYRDKDGTFYIIWFDRDFTLYDHG